MVSSCRTRIYSELTDDDIDDLRRRFTDLNYNHVNDNDITRHFVDSYCGWNTPDNDQLKIMRPWEYSRFAAVTANLLKWKDPILIWGGPTGETRKMGRCRTLPTRSVFVTGSRGESYYRELFAENSDYGKLSVHWDSIMQYTWNTHFVGEIQTSASTLQDYDSTFTFEHQRCLRLGRTYLTTIAGLDSNLVGEVRLIQQHAPRKGNSHNQFRESIRGNSFGRMEQSRIISSRIVMTDEVTTMLNSYRTAK